MNPPFFNIEGETDYVDLLQWLLDGSYTERWEQGLRPRLYHGRTGAFFRSDSANKVPFKDWGKPILTPNDIPTGAGTIESEAPWRTSISITNSQDGVTVNAFYIGLPKAHFDQMMSFEAYLPVGGAGTQLYIGFEANSGGAFHYLVCLANIAGTWELYAVDKERVSAALTAAVTLNYPADWARYHLLLQYPYLKFYQSTAANPLILELAATLDLNTMRPAKAIPFFANESTLTVQTMKIGNFWVSELKPDLIEVNQAWTNPAANPSLTCNVAGRSNIEIYAQGITVGTAVYVENSQDGTNFYDADELTLAITNPSALKTVSAAYRNATRYVRVTINEHVAGNYKIKINGSAT